VKGVEIVNLGYTGGRLEVRDQVVADVTREKRDDNLVIVSFYWGIEYFNDVSSVQLKLGHAAVDAGADLVLGSHPRVLQGIEEYGGRHIVYSLGSFVYGGDSNPADTDAMIYQEVFALTHGKVTKRTNHIVPVRMTTATHGNDFRPVLLEGDDEARVLRRIAAFSASLSRHEARGRVRASRGGASAH
jgi:poly-gamma-glutamate capsule biosynthesis protein CapA/YwtB (metallophosphatase superfamily)